MRAVVLLSGGLDSATVAWDLALDFPITRIHALSVDYGQRHRRELDAAVALAGRLGIRHTIASLRLPLAGSALTDQSVEVPEGHYTDQSMRSTIVPNRNAMFLTMAFALAVADGADVVAFGCHAGDHPIYADCRPGFIRAVQAMQDAADADAEPDDRIQLVTPFLHQTKADIVRTGDALGVPWDLTWSCYQGGSLHCGRCGTCVERREAFELAGLVDPTEYEGAADVSHR